MKLETNGDKIILTTLNRKAFLEQLATEKVSPEKIDENIVIILSTLALKILALQDEIDRMKYKCIS